MPESLSLAQARRIALAAQGFGKRRKAGVGRAALFRTIQRLGLLQIDSVNVLVRAQYMPLFSRLGPYDREALDRLAYRRDRKLFEYWGHEASLLPLETFALLRWRMELARRGVGTWRHVAEIAREQPQFVASVEAAIRTQGPMAASEFEGSAGKGSWWGWSDVKRALEFLFWTGTLTTAMRRTSFERVYDLTERVLPHSVTAARVDGADARRKLLRIAARASGVATESDLRDYFRLGVTDARTGVAELVASGGLLPVTVQGWKQPAYLDARYKQPRHARGSALLSPFDPLVWNRPRARRLFDFDYRLEIYTPSHKRVHGYYVLPYLLDEALVARVDVKADRGNGVLRVLAVHYEAAADVDVVRERLRADLGSLAQWLGLERTHFQRSSAAASTKRRTSSPVE